MTKFASLLIGALLLLGLAGPAQAAEYALVVNAANPASDDAETRQIIKRLYLKEASSWPDGAEAQPFAREAGTPEQTAFYTQVLGMDETAVDEHWLRVKQVKGETPPRSIGSSRIIYRLVGKYAGSFAVVSADEIADAPAEVKVLFTFTD